MSASAPQPLAVYYRILAGSASSLVASRAVTFLANLFLIPYIIVRVGVEGYGTLAAVSALVTLIAMVDLGLGSTSVKFLAEQIKRRDVHAVNRIFWSASLTLVGLTAMLLAAVVAIGEPGLRLFGIPESRLSEVFAVYAVMVGSSMLSTVMRIFLSLIWALHRVDVVSWVNLGVIPLYVGGVVWALESGWGVVGVAFAEALAMSVVPALCFVWIARALYPPLRLRPRFFSMREARSLLSYGMRIQSSTALNTFYGQGGRFVAGSVLGLAPLAFYDLGARLAQPLGMFPALVAPLFVPIFSQLNAEGSRMDVRDLYRRGTKLLVIILLPVAVFGSLFAESVIAIWMGPGYGVAAFGFACFLWLYLFDGITQVGRAGARGIGKPGMETHFELSRVVVSLVTAGVGGWVGGFSGLVLALTVSSSAACLFFLWRVCSLTETRNLDCVREMIGIPLLAVAVSAIAGLGVFRATDSMIDFSGRLGDLSQLVITGGAFMLTYLGGLIRSGYLAPRDLWTTYRQSAQAEVCPDLPPAP